MHSSPSQILMEARADAAARVAAASAAKVAALLKSPSQPPWTEILVTPPRRRYSLPDSRVAHARGMNSSPSPILMAARAEATARVAAASAEKVAALLKSPSPPPFQAPPPVSAPQILIEVSRSYFPVNCTVQHVAERFLSCSRGFHGRCFGSCSIPRIHLQGVVVRTEQANDRARVWDDTVSGIIFIFVGPDGKKILARLGGRGRHAGAVLYGVTVV